MTHIPTGRLCGILAHRVGSSKLLREVADLISERLVLRGLGFERFCRRRHHIGCNDDVGGNTRCGHIGHDSPSVSS